ncbi:MULTISPECIES: metal ABC transporter ATP-binding protein [Kytococcus]|uniref:Metal ABC transporter ATP-binding protein n=1 Tax=Kytococcus schroeteri TaxID=138300 RepID=A0A2I1PB77_9MICO|nr:MULTISPECIES: ATP-binding cassette domain-containing protein [Kytococcus]OFS12655.1 metal ABC transporter ATP-binding protein [Kytococcus sp. HMSC28H12]PKZ41882.1 metal ABC transporter ATP-binding protein [Kytococcus schroeteri]
MSDALVLQEVVYGYDGHPAVGPVSATVPAGQSVAITGPNGAGKSTLVTGLLGLTDQLSGRAELLGTPLRRLRDRTRIGYVPQHHSVTGALHATVGEVILAGRVAALPWWRHPGRSDRELARRAAADVGLEDRLHHNLADLSGGQRRRALLARAIVSRPALLVLDEPTAGVDLANQELLAVLLRRLADDGLTMLVITHELDPIASALDRVLTLTGGRLTDDRMLEVHRG